MSERRARDLAFHHLVQPLAVERARQRVVPCLGAGLVQLFLQASHLCLFFGGALTQFGQFGVGQSSVQCHGARCLHHLAQHRGDVLDAAGLRDLLGVAFHLVLVAAAGIRHGRQAFDEGGQHFLHLILRFDHPALGLGLLEDHVLEAALHIVEPPQCERLSRGGHQRFGLAVQPLVVDAQRRDVGEHHVQQLQQHAANGSLVLGGERQAEGEVAQHELEGAGWRVGLAQEAHQLLAQQMDAGVIAAQTMQRMFNEARELFGQFFVHRARAGADGAADGGAEWRRAGGGGRGVQVGGRCAGAQLGVAHQNGLHGRPVFLVDGGFELLQQALLCRCLAGNDAQDLAQWQFWEGQGRAGPGDFVIDLPKMLRRGGEAALGELLERFARNV